MGVVIRAGVKAALETRRKLAEVRAQAEARVRAVRRFGSDLDRGGSDQSLNFAHCRHQTVLLGDVEGLQHRLREIVREPVIGRAFRGPFARQARMTATTVVISLRHSDQPLPLSGIAAGD